MSLSDKIWWTEKARIHLEKRLLSNANHADFIVLWYSFCSIASSIYFFGFNPDNKYAALAWVVFSVFILTVSTLIGTSGYKLRAGLAKGCHESLNALYVKCKLLEGGGGVNRLEEGDLIKEYQHILSLTENHTTYDFYKAIIVLQLEKATIDKRPNWFVWFFVLLKSLMRLLVLLFLYLLPISLFVCNFYWL